MKRRNNPVVVLPIAAFLVLYARAGCNQARGQNSKEELLAVTVTTVYKTNVAEILKPKQTTPWTIPTALAEIQAYQRTPPNAFPIIQGQETYWGTEQNWPKALDYAPSTSSPIEPRMKTVVTTVTRVDYLEFQFRGRLRFLVLETFLDRTEEDYLEKSEWTKVEPPP